MQGRFNRDESWEKQSVFLLDNGWMVTVENSYYGEIVARLDKDGKYWHCSNGIENTGGISVNTVPLPEFARSWVNGGDHCSSKNLVRPNFEKVY